MNAAIAMRMGRPDLISNYGSGLGATGNPNSSPAMTGAFSMSAGGNAASGQLSLGILGAVILGMVGFYFWTRKYQH